MRAFAPLLKLLMASKAYMAHLGDDRVWIMRGVIQQVQQAGVFQQLSVLVDACVQRLAAPVPPAALAAIQSGATTVSSSRQAAARGQPARAAGTDADQRMQLTELWGSKAGLLQALRLHEVMLLQNLGISNGVMQPGDDHVAALAAALSAAAMQHVSRVLQQLPEAVKPPAVLREMGQAVGRCALWRCKCIGRRARGRRW